MEKLRTHKIYDDVECYRYPHSLKKILEYLEKISESKNKREETKEEYDKELEENYNVFVYRTVVYPPDSTLPPRID